jgi:hypothetical protein
MRLKNDMILLISRTKQAKVLTSAADEIDEYSKGGDQSNAD